MRCKRIRRQLSAYIDGEISPRTRIRMEKHLAKCPQCRRYREELSLVAESLRRLGRIEPSTEFSSETMRRIRAATKVPVSAPVSVRRWAVAFASCIVIGMCILGWLVYSANRTGSALSDKFLLTEVGLVAGLLGEEGMEEIAEAPNLDETRVQVVLEGMPLVLTTSYSGEADSGSVPIEGIIEMLSSREKMELRMSLLNSVKEG